VLDLEQFTGAAGPPEPDRRGDGQGPRGHKPVLVYGLLYADDACSLPPMPARPGSIRSAARW
jgi:hypothetical protein